MCLSEWMYVHIYRQSQNRALDSLEVLTVLIPTMRVVGTEHWFSIRVIGGLYH